MDEDVAAKAPVTRLRRRLSVEQSEESKSPAPSTPTKKRGGRPAKPQLELIEENAPEKTPNKRATRKSLARDVEEEKPLTPSRRSARIRSNTSIISDTPQNSPRAKRATRRTSQVGSDGEAPSQATTPARTRRTRKDSTTNIDKPGDTTLITEVISEEPELEPSKTVKTPETNKDMTISPNSLRKSTRLLAKQDKRKSGSVDEESPNRSNEKTETVTPKKVVNEDLDKTTSKTPASAKKKQQLENTEEVTDKNEISISSRNLIEQTTLNPPQKSSKALNKSLSSLKEANNNKRTRTKSWTTMSMSPSNESNFYSDNESFKKKVKSKFNLNNDDKTGSGDGLLNISLKDNNNLTKDETEIVQNSKTKRKKKNSLANDSYQEQSLNSIVNKESKSEHVIVANVKEKLNVSDTLKLFETSPEAVVRSKVYIEDSDSNTDAIENQQPNEDQCVPVISHVLENQSKSPKSIQVESNTVALEEAIINQSCEPMDIDETMPQVTLDDSNSKSINESIGSKNRKNRSSDVVDSNLFDSKNNSKRKSSFSNSISEDINKSQPQLHVSQNESIKSNNKRKSSVSKLIDEDENENNVKSKNLSNRKSSLSNSILEDVTSVNQSRSKAESETSISKNISKPKTSISNTVNEELDKSENQNKSTLVLSHIKESEVSTTSKRDISLNVTDIEKDNKTLKNISSTNYSTSTPLQDKVSTKMLKQRVPINVSDIITKQNKKNNSSENSEGDSSDDDSEDESKGSKLVIDEAEEASDDYESGDSQDEEERRYEKENEIIDKGETLTSDDDASNDTDYEKDSFVVSSDEEDVELLDGSGDDLAMSDNELTMGSKSKKKFNERKAKEQKEASREMFNARHNVNDSKTRLSKTSDSKRGKQIDSKLLDSDDESEKTKPKKSNRLRLESTQEDGMITSDADESIQIKKKKSKRLSESMVNSDADESIKIGKKNKNRLSESTHEDANDEKEITICAEAEPTERDPLEKIKEEPKTPNKSIISENIESVQVDEVDATTMKINESRDPLQATLADQNEDEDDSSDISSNPEITSDYTNLLNNLNNVKSKEKKKDISLNIDKKAKAKNKEPIVDQLNLTLTKNKKKKSAELQTDNKVSNKKVVPVDEENSSDSIDMKLLFTEESNDSEDKPQPNTFISGEDFIPLKRTEAKTNILDTSSINKSANESLSKSAKRKSKTNQSFVIENDEGINKSLNLSKSNKNDSSLLGADKNKSIQNVSLTASAKKNKKTNLSFAAEDKNTSENVESSIVADLSLNTSLKKKKKNSISLTTEEPQSTVDVPVIVIHGGEKKKKNSISKDDNELEVSLNQSGRKVKKNSISELNESANTSLKSSNKKKNVSTAEEKDDDMPEEVPFKFEKSKASDTPKDTLEDNVKTPKSAKKDKKDTANLSKTAEEMAEKCTPKSPKGSQTLIEATSVTEKEEETNVQTSESSKKKRKRKKKNLSKDNSNEDQDTNIEETRKRKLSAMSSIESEKAKDQKILNISSISSVGHKKKKQKLIVEEPTPEIKIQSSEKANRKRKNREGDSNQQVSKVMKETSDSAVPRLPVDLLSKLDDKPNKEILEQKKAKVVSTSEFEVETAKIRKNKPSQYLEESVYLNDDSPEKNKLMRKIKKPKVLPFVPTATTSGHGFTTSFKVSVIPAETKFVAKTTETNFKNDYLQKKMKKFGTYELYKTQRKIKLSKF